ncbi:MAG: head GIN domain-containing protein [Methylococcales bacterium]|nr:head GIN domain-containing protein [Methylococcales bacterium]
MKIPSTIQLLIVSLMAFSQHSYSGQFFSNNNTVSTGKITINNVDISDQNILRGSGKYATKVVSVQRFNAVDSQGGFQLVFRQGRQAVEFRGDDNLIERIRYQVDGDTLKLTMPEPYTTHNDLVIAITLDQLKRIKVAGSSNVQLNSLNTDSLALELSGSVDVRGQGHSQTLQVLVQGSGDVDLRNWQANDVIIEASGATDFHVAAKDTLKVRASGAGDIVYYGNPELTTRLSGVTDIEKGD